MGLCLNILGKFHFKTIVVVLNFFLLLLYKNALIFFFFIALSSSEMVFYFLIGSFVVQDLLGSGFRTAVKNWFARPNIAR